MRSTSIGWLVKPVASIAVMAMTIATGHTGSAQETSLFRQPLPAAQASNQAGLVALPGMVGTQGVAPEQVPPLSSDQAVGLANGYPVGTPGYNGLGLANASWTFTPARPLRNYRIQDIVTIRVDEVTRVQADGALNSRRTGIYDAILKDWIGLHNGKLTVDEQSTGDPRVNGETNQAYRSTSSLKTNESLAFNIAARVADIQPNGNLVLEATKTIRMNENIWQTSLIGICRAQDIAPDNVVLSRDLVDLQIRKNEAGEVRDGYKRGWFTRWLNEFNPF